MEIIQVELTFLYMHPVAPSEFFRTASLDWFEFMNVSESQVEKGSCQAAKTKQSQGRNRRPSQRSKISSRAKIQAGGKRIIVSELPL